MKNWVRILLVIIPVIGGIIVAILNHHDSNPPIILPKKDSIQFVSLIFSGTVMDENSQGLKLAKVQIVGKTENFITEDDGNFRFEVPMDKSLQEKRIRVIINRTGYKGIDQTVTLPAEGLIFPLEKR